MSLKPYSPYTYPLSEPEKTTNGFLLRDNMGVHNLIFLIFFGFPMMAAILVGIFSLFVPSYSITLDPMIIYLIPVIIFAIFLYIRYLLKRHRRLYSPELFLKAYPVPRGISIDLDFSQELQGNKSCPNSGPILWRITCAEVTATEVGTNETTTHCILWSQEFTANQVLAGAKSLKSKLTVTLPNQFPATLEPVISRASILAPRIRNWVEWQVQIDHNIPGLKIDGSKFILQVK
jgi:hypothetical protein